MGCELEWIKLNRVINSPFVIIVPIGTRGAIQQFYVGDYQDQSLIKNSFPSGIRPGKVTEFSW